MKQSLRNSLKKVPFLKQAVDSYRSIATIKKRLEYLEQRVHNYRWYAMELAADYLVGAQVEGDYCEFGVYKGDTFAHFLQYHEIFPKMRYFAFDSFEGLPPPSGIDNENGYTSNFHAGEFAFGETDFLSNIKKKKLPLDRVKTIKGWFNKTLTPETASEHKIEKISFAWVDCDLYESTIPILEFLTDKISVGTLIVFDDWKVYRNLADKGEQRACQEWLDRNPGIQLNPLFDFSHFGRAFTVAKVPQ